jgi:ssDNA-binding Zn-finger/Zn-ribbon topoisomerase 1
MADIRCPSCGTDEIHGSPGGTDGGILLTCDRCGERWSRQPQLSCPRCHTPDPYHRRYWGWQYDDNVEARENTMAAYDDVLHDEFRCSNCNYVWKTEVERREGRGVPWRQSLGMRQPRRQP